MSCRTPGAKSTRDKGEPSAEDSLEGDEDIDENEDEGDQDEDEELDKTLASDWKRLLHLWVDEFVSMFVARFLLGFTSDGGRSVTKVDRILWMLFVYGCYCLFFEAVFQHTPAKWMTRTHVISENGERAGFRQILKRTLCRFIPIDGISFFFGADWHDRWSGTRVINDVPRD